MEQLELMFITTMELMLNEGETERKESVTNSDNFVKISTFIYYTLNTETYTKVYFYT